MNYSFRILFVILFSFFLGIINSQQFKFSENINTSPDYKPYLCFSVEGNYILVQKKIKSSICDLKLNLFNSNLKSTNQFDVKIKEHVFVSMRQIFNKIFLFTSKNENNSTLLYVHEFNINNGFINSKQIYKEKNNGGYTAKFIISKSSYEDQFFILVELPFQSGKNEDIKLLYFDNSLALIDEVYNKLEVPFESKRDNKLLVSSIGKVYLIKTFWDKGNNFFIYPLGSEVVNELEIKLSNRKIAAIDYFFNGENELVIAGFFTSQKRYNYEGYFIHKYDSDLSLVHKNQYFLSSNIVEAFKSAKEIKEKGFGLDKFRLSNFSLDANGNHFLLAEHLTRKEVKSVNNWYSKGLLVIKFNKNGNYVWGCPVIHKQTYVDIKFLGAFKLNNFNDAQYFYNSLENINLRKGVPVEYGSNNFCGTKSISFSSVGLSEKNILRLDIPNNEGMKYAFYPKQLNPYETSKSIFSLLDKDGNNIILGLEL